MGKDKALLRLFGPSGPDLLAKAHDLLAGLLPTCWVSCRREQPRLGYDCLFDAVENAGPAAGVLEGLRAAQKHNFAAVLALSCDMPFMDAPTLGRLLAARLAAPAGTLATLYVDAESGRPEALAAIYETAALPLFAAAVSGERIRLNNVVPLRRQHRLAYTRDAAGPFFNLNSPEDLVLALDLPRASR
jgi:Molybdopterin-guanine dinucleotide biosynthesis protein A